MAYRYIYSCLVPLALLVGSVLAQPLSADVHVRTQLQPQPSVVLDQATVVGQRNGTVIKYLGLPFAQPPFVFPFPSQLSSHPSTDSLVLLLLLVLILIRSIGDLRLRLPKPISPYTGTINATAFGNQCIQQTSEAVSLPSTVPAAVGGYVASFLARADVPFSEDCLNLNVIVPAEAHPESKLPVAVWIYGGGFQIGSNAVNPGEVVVARSIEIGHPVIFVAMNYRLSAFGFLGGSEVKETGVGNLGLHDQREALRWIQKYISAFGGDPEKVMIWGESAGATSVALQMQTNAGDTEGLFRAAFLESGTPIATGHVDNPYLQSIYDEIVADSGCANATVALECLRTVPAEVLKAAMDKTPSFVSFRQLNIPWFPRADGTFIPRPSQQLLLDGPIANVPFIVGNDVDEGTIVSFGTLNVTTDDEFLDYIHSNYYRNTSRAAVAKILDLYPSDPAAGSPFNTGDKYAYSPQFKRMSAFQGDFFGQAPRRLFVQHLAEKQPVYSYLSNYHTVDGIGAAHGMELADVFGGGPLGDYLIRFAATLDPNGDGAFHWPRYTTSAPLLLTLNDPAPALNLTTDTSHGDEAFEWPHYPLLTLNDTVPALNLTEDTYRAEQMAYLTKLSLADPM